MATMPIGYLPELTKEQAREIFAQGFAGKYEIINTPVLRRDFVVKKSGWAGVGVKLQQDSDKTTFVYTGMMPNFLLQALFGGLASYMFLRKSWRAMEQEVAEFIATAPEFRPAQAVQPPVKAKRANKQAA
jgi:hypothetical protein